MNTVNQIREEKLGNGCKEHAMQIFFLMQSYIWYDTEVEELDECFYIKNLSILYVHCQLTLDQRGLQYCGCVVYSGIFLILTVFIMSLSNLIF